MAFAVTSRRPRWKGPISLSVLADSVSGMRRGPNQVPTGLAGRIACQKSRVTTSLVCAVCGEEKWWGVGESKREKR